MSVPVHERPHHSEPTGIGAAIAHELVDHVEHDFDWGAIGRAFGAALGAFLVLTALLSSIIYLAADGSQSVGSTNEGIPVLAGSFSAFFAFLLGGLLLRRTTTLSPLLVGAVLASCALVLASIVALVDLALQFPITGMEGLELFAIFIVPTVAFPASIIGSAVVPPMQQHLDEGTFAEEPEF